MKQFITFLFTLLLIIAIGCSPTEPQQQVESEVNTAVIKKPDDKNQQVVVKENDKAKPSEPYLAKKQLLEEHIRAQGRHELSDAIAPQSVVAMEYAMGTARTPSVSLDSIRHPSEPLNRENYAVIDDNPIKRVLEHPVSTFSIDVDTGSYANVRRFLKAGNLPVQDAVRAEELINYFSYDYPLPEDQRVPFSLIREIAPSPWNPDTYLLHIGIQGYDVALEQLPASNLVFLVDISGSMQSPDKLGLLKNSLKLLTNHLDKNDRISMVVYAGGTGVVLQPTAGDQKATINAAIDQLTAGGRTNGAAGIKLAYAMAEQGFIRNGINRVLLATDGDFNVGTTNIEQLKDLIEEKRKTGIALSTLGFGTGNYNDYLMEQLADNGNGNYAYIDTLSEAQKVLVDEMSSTLLTIAKDVKIQIEFNPELVEEYRLIGYENRLLNREDFNNDKIDAGEIGAGHTVTALYEVALKGKGGAKMDPLRYQSEESVKTGKQDELAFLRLRYKEPGASKSQLLEWPIKRQEIVADINRTSDAFRFSAAVAMFAQQLRGGKYTGQASYDDTLALASGARGQDPFGYHGEFITLVNLAKSLSSKAHDSDQVADSTR